MIFVTGPAFAGKTEYICRTLGWSAEDFAEKGVRGIEENAYLQSDLAVYADRLSQKEVVIATEIGAGVVPADPVERERREAAGRLSCLLAERADTVVRVCCGLPRILKGKIG